MTEQAQPEQQTAPTDTPAATEEQKPAGKKPGVHPRDAVKQFAQAWPEVFSADFKNVRPLAIGILQDILKQRPAELDGLNSKAIRTAMKFYTSRLAYHHAMLKHEHRYNLDGSEAEAIDDGARTHAQEQIEAIQKARAERQKQQTDDNADGKKPRDPREKTRRLQRKTRAKANGKTKSSGKPRTTTAASSTNNEANAHLSMEEKLDRLAQHFGKPGAK